VFPARVMDYSAAAEGSLILTAVDIASLGDPAKLNRLYKLGASAGNCFVLGLFFLILI